MVPVFRKFVEIEKGCPDCIGFGEIVTGAEREILVTLGEEQLLEGYIAATEAISPLLRVFRCPIVVPGIAGGDFTVSVGSPFFEKAVGP